MVGYCIRFFIHSHNKRFWRFTTRQFETWVSLCHLMPKHSGLPLSSGQIVLTVKIVESNYPMW